MLPSLTTLTTNDIGINSNPVLLSGSSVNLGTITPYYTTIFPDFAVLYVIDNNQHIIAIDINIPTKPLISNVGTYVGSNITMYKPIKFVDDYMVIITQSGIINVYYCGNPLFPLIVNSFKLNSDQIGQIDIDDNFNLYVPTVENDQLTTYVTGPRKPVISITTIMSS